MKSAKEMQALAEGQKQAAVLIVDKSLLGTPDGFENRAARELVDAIIAAALLEFAAAQKTAAEEGEEWP